jgi:hypothetical protein
MTEILVWFFFFFEKGLKCMIALLFRKVRKGKKGLEE